MIVVKRAKSFELSTSALTSRATHQITGSRFHIPQGIFTEIRTRLGIARSAPVISTHVKVEELGHSVLTLLGMDPFSETYFRNVTVRPQNYSEGRYLSGLLSGRAGVLVSQHHGEQYGVKPGDPLTLLFGERRVKTRIAGFLDTYLKPSLKNEKKRNQARP